MEQLSAYVAAIHDKPSPLTISVKSVERSSWTDQGFEVSKEIAEYRFGNGVIIRRTVEQDDFPSETACAECWITYEVISKGPLPEIVPARKTFENTCRESFWLAYHTT
jgi:hypothetical protein